MKPELRRCRMAEGCMMALRYGMVFFNLLFWGLLLPGITALNVAKCFFLPDQVDQVIFLKNILLWYI
ncbi:hypothetical protein CHARACLAT_006734 [Characodon lateralis]|uniref:Uncharacterized protein n=1 Tax=Characodon lateralis TaxID=208331 RepID=A0ABU7EIE2_9TELE|nr:hypothetical protein [Characodon lateralis]